MRGKFPRPTHPISFVDPLGLLRLQAGIDDPPSWVGEKPAKSDSSYEIADAVSMVIGAGETVAGLKAIFQMTRSGIAAAAAGSACKMTKNINRAESLPLGGKGIYPTGRYFPYSLAEQLAMAQAKAHPLAGEHLTEIILTDPRWLATEGWIKMSQTINGIEIHYVYNTITRVAADFKIQVIGAANEGIVYRQ